MHTPVLAIVVPSYAINLAYGGRDVIFSTNKKIMTSKEYAEYLIAQDIDCALEMVNTMILKGNFEFGALEELYLEKVKTELEKLK